MKANRLFDLSGKVALVTGASSGLGWTFARTLAANGARVVLAARRIDRLEALRGEIAADGGEAAAVALDVTDPAAVPAAFEAAEAAYGTVTVLVNNAGVAAEAPVLEQSFADWRKVLDTNLDGVMRVAQEGARRMVAAGETGSVVNIASVLGFGVAKTLSAYAVAKAGVVQLTKAMALELADTGVRVNALAPGYILTDINRDFFASETGRRFAERRIPMKRIGETHDLDGPLVLLASDASRFMTGSVIVADGGQLVRGV